MHTLIIGSGGREHALAWKCAQSHLAHHRLWPDEPEPRVYVAPGNAGTALEPGVENVSIAETDIEGLVAFAETHHVGLTIVGPETPLALGIVDRFIEAGLLCFGPTKAAAQLESSKAFSKSFMVRHGIPTAAYASFTESDQAIAYIKTKTMPIVIKADGLAAGKGVVIAKSEEEAIESVIDMLAGNRFGDAGSRVVVEDFLTGEEASFIVLCDGQHVLPLASSQDHKTRDNGNLGPNTGGMGACSPAPVVTDALAERILQTVIMPTMRGMASDGIPYTGFLYAGIMITPEGDPYVLEFNCRLGDPETQPILMRLTSDLVALCRAAVSQTLDQVVAEWDPRPALGVVIAAGGYPFDYKKGDAITGLDKAEQLTSLTSPYKIFHAGTKQQSDQLVTAGGRVLCVTSLGETLANAKQNAYTAIEHIHFDQCYFRTDIGDSAIARQQ